MNSGNRHTEYIALMPAYLQQLAAEKAAELVSHCQQCEACAAELRYVRQLHEHFQRQLDVDMVAGNANKLFDGEADWLNAAHEQNNFDRLWSRIEYNTQLTAKNARRRWLPAALAATLLLAIALPLYKKTLAPDYQTLADSSARIACGQLRVRFIDNFPSADMQNLLQSVAAHIVEGPTPRGVYTLRTDKSAATVLHTLHLHPAVALVEPTDC